MSDRDYNAYADVDREAQHDYYDEIPTGRHRALPDGAPETLWEARELEREFEADERRRCRNERT